MGTEMRTNHTVVIVGAGMSGLLLAKLLSDAQFQVRMIEKKQPKFNIDDDTISGRVSALNANIVEYLKKIGVWQQCRASRFSTLSKMRVWDHCGGGEVEFDSASVAKPYLACVVENKELIRSLWQLLQDAPNVQIETQQEVVSIDVKANEASIETPTGKVDARLVVGADGALSTMRRHLPLFCRVTPYQQTALVAAVESEYPHHNVALQSFLPTGPLGVLPLANPHHESFVFSCENSYAHKLLSMDRTEFNRELESALQCRYGKLQLLNPLQSFPLVERHMSQPYHESVVLIGDAAQTIHPLAGQGANSGLQDAIWLAHTLIQSRRHFFSEESVEPLLAAYWRRRQCEHVFLRQTMKAFSQLYAGDATYKVRVRSGALVWCNRLQLLKNEIMKMMIGLGGLPV